MLMSKIDAECATMAAAMLDAEIALILRKIDEDGPLTTLQAAIVAEGRARGLTGDSRERDHSAVGMLRPSRTSGAPL